MNVDHATAPVADVRRTALYLEGAGGAVFAWLHERLPDGRPTQSPPPRRRGAIVCPSLGHELLHAHRTLRTLADEAALAGCTVLRLDYHGTGDSPGDEMTPDRVETWIENIVRAARWLRESGRVDEATLIGFRAGALLAMAAAEREPCAGLVLWAPPAKGSAFVRELRAISLTAAATANLARREGDPLESSGFRLSHETCVALGKLNAADLRPRTRRALVVSRDEFPANERLCEQLRTAEVEVREIGGPGFADIVTLPHETKVPRDTIGAIATWLNESREAGTAAIDVGDSGEPVERKVCRAEASPGVRERPLVLCDDPYLFGIESSPFSDAAPDDRPWVVMVNAGSAYRIAPGRLHVELARRLSSRGWRTLRFDLDGLGDSTTRRSRRENDPYPATALRDIGLALRGLRTQAAAQRFVLVGLCSGAYDVFQFAAQNDDPAVLESLLINPLTFYWREGMQVDDAGNLKWNTWLTYVDSALQWDKWRRLLTGKNRNGVLGTFKKFARGVGIWPSPASAPSPASPASPALPASQRGVDVDSAAGRAGGASEFGGHPQRDDLRGDLARIVQSGRRLTMFFADSDPGPLILKMRAGRKVRQLERDGRLVLQYFPDSDHTFSVARARDALIQALTSHLERTYLAPGESATR